MLRDGTILVPSTKVSPYSTRIRSPQKLLGFFHSIIHLLKVSRVTLLAKGSNVFLLVKHRSPQKQVLGTLVYGGNNKGIEVLLTSHHLTWHKGEVTLTLKLSQLIQSTNIWHHEGRQPSLPSTPHSRIHISSESPWKHPGLAAASQSLLIGPSILP
jgi:hypothetical protein